MKERLVAAGGKVPDAQEVHGRDRRHGRFEQLAVASVAKAVGAIADRGLDRASNGGAEESDPWRAWA
ncbi:hypothetical protein D3C72_2437580 [compost metagenome]